MTAARAGVYYWKCDRPAAFHGVIRKESAGPSMLDQLQETLADVFPGPFFLREAGGRGNHHTFRLQREGVDSFVRIEDGPEGDGYLAVESRILEDVARTGVPVPRVDWTDVSRSRVPFAVQVIGFFDCPDLGKLHQKGLFRVESVAEEIGRSIARWQSVEVSGFGPFSGESLQQEKRLRGFHSTYASYFMLNLDRHLASLSEAGFLSSAEINEIKELITQSRSLLDLKAGCLVHKDLALWNILGTMERGIEAFIDWDDAIAGDPTDDLSLLACFHGTGVLEKAVEGYCAERSLPVSFLPRFWLHLLRNMIVKAVIRGAAGYFRKDSFVAGPGQNGEDLRRFTRDRLFLACEGLKNNLPLAVLTPL